MDHIIGMIKGNLFDFIITHLLSIPWYGFGDLLPTGAIRMLDAAKDLAGVMITWSASFILGNATPMAASINKI